MRRRPEGVNVVSVLVLAKYLHGALIQIMCLGQLREMLTSFDRDEIDAQVCEKDGQVQTATTPAHHQNIRFFYFALAH